MQAGGGESLRGEGGGGGAATALEPAELCVLLQSDFEDVVAARSPSLPPPPATRSPLHLSP
eukprot:903693-Rhodomonas_salina.1